MTQAAVPGGMPYLRGSAQGVELTVHVQPGASREEIVGTHGDALKVRVDARAVEGAANGALVEFLAHALGVPRREVRILRGEKARRKVLAVTMPIQDATARLARLLGVESTERVGKK